MKAARYILLALLAVTCVSAMAQHFHNLTEEEVRIDSVVPKVSYAIALPENSRDSVYTVEIQYPEFADMPEEEKAKYIALCPDLPPAMPEIETSTAYARKRASLLCSFTPIVFREGRYQYLASFKLKACATARNAAESMEEKSRGEKLVTRSEESGSRYAEHSVLATGQWAKIRVSDTGFYELTNDVIRRAGFSDPAKVHVYGYGGNIVPETLTPEYLLEYDDLKPVETAIVNGKRIFYAKGPVSWTGNLRVRNPYSSYGYYFITQGDTPQDTISVEAMTEKWREDNTRYYSLYETDNYAWMNGGRNLVDAVMTNSGSERKITIASPEHSNLQSGGYLTLVLTAKVASTYQVSLNDSILGSGSIKIENYDEAKYVTLQYRLRGLAETNTLKIACTSGGPLRMDYALIRSNVVDEGKDITAMTFPAAEYVYNITNQDHHADSSVDLTILIPTSQHFMQQAQRLKTHHEEKDGMTVRIVPADELYNEFSSGTPDVSAYKRYMKMMYDRAATDEEQPKYLLLFGDCMWDNRLLTSDCRTLDADNLLLCYESENSYNEVDCFVSDDFIGMLDDNEKLNEGNSYLGIPDIGIGRFTVYTTADAQVVVDKTISYAENANAGAWQNVLMFMGDDGNDNLHMKDNNETAESIKAQYPGYNVRKVMWDAYKREETTVGSRYPEVREIILSQQKAGALIMDYSGHGARNSISHEVVLELSDFEAFQNKNLPLWVTASCQVGPFDGVEPTIGENVLTNANGGGIAFYGTTRTVYANYNKYINSAFVNAVLDTSSGKRTTLGEANRKAKEYLVTSGRDRTVNKLQYSLLGDPALALNTPLMQCVIDSINGVDINSYGAELPQIHANSKVSVAGHISNNGAVVEDYNGLISLLVKDSEEEITCFDNAKEANEPFVFTDRTKNLFSGTDSVRNGRFMLNFVVPKDINYSDKSGQITLFAYSDKTAATAHGKEERFLIGGSETSFNDSIGPSVYCYLNSRSFVNGGEVNSKPYFFAEIMDRDGINSSGAGIGHDMQLVIDNDITQTYTLNDYFTYDFGTYASGFVSYAIPELTPGTHSLRFRVWDVMNNPSTTELTFNVVKGLTPEILSVETKRNSGGATFIITHNRPGTDVVIDIEIYDPYGRLLHIIPNTELGGTTSTLTWDGTTNTGKRMTTGVYIYRVNVACEGSKKASMAGKMVIAGN